jgi:hypothetical protein
MLYLVCIGILTSMLAGLYHVEGHLVVYESFERTHVRFMILISALYSKYTSLGRLTMLALMVFSEAIYITLVQKLNKSVKKIDRHTFEITYVINGKLYKMRVKPKRGPSPVLQISNEEQSDVTDQVLPYMGPSYDWHGNTFSPDCFGHQTLVFEFADGSEITFEQKSTVSLSKNSD